MRVGGAGDMSLQNTAFQGSPSERVQMRAVGAVGEGGDVAIKGKESGDDKWVFTGASPAPAGIGG